MTVQKAPPQPALITVEEFFALSPDGEKADLIDGVIYVASPDTPDNNELASLIQILMDGFASAHGLGKVYASRVAFVLTTFRAPEPDVAFLRKDRLRNVKKSRVMGGPDIAVEVISRDSRSRDSVDKKRLYEEAGVREYWLIDPMQQRADFYRLNEGRYALASLERNRIFRSEVLPGFWLDVEWLFADPLPNKFECLQQVLAGDPAD
jgi:Uma2 family endonuclease